MDHPKILYHSTPYPRDGDILNPSTRNIAIRETADGAIAEQIDYSEENAAYLYAADSAQLAATYAVTKGVRLGNCTMPSGIDVLYVDQERTIGDPELKGGLYSFESDHFVQMHSNGKPTNQW